MDRKECSSCCKEPTGSVPVPRIIAKIDSLFARNEYEEAGRVLDYWEEEARKLNDEKGLLTILSEKVGYYRTRQEKEKGLSAVEEALGILEYTEDDESINNATIYLNCATTMKAFGKAQESMQYYEKARVVYEKHLEKDDFRLAGLYNNMATAFQELKDYDSAIASYEKAISVLKSKEICGEIAVSYVNLANLYFDRDAALGSIDFSKSEEYMNLAFEVLSSGNLKKDGNFAFICTKCAPAFGFFGYFMEKEQLLKWADEIYSR